MGSGGDTSKSSQSGPNIPAWLRPFLTNTAKDWTSAQGQLPDISQLYSQIPMLNVPGLQGNELNAINQFEQTGNSMFNSGGANSAQQGAQGQLESFINQSGPSASTQAAEKSFNDFAAPEIMSQASLMGLGNSGAGLEAISQGQERALVPFLQQDEQNKLSAAGQLGSLGGQEFGQLQSSMASALEAAGMPRDIATQQSQALFNQQQQRQQFGQQVQMGP